MRFVNSLELKDNIECFILIEPGLGYIIPVLREKFKTCKIIALHIGDFPPVPDSVALQKCDDDDLRKFLEKEVPDTDSKNIRIIEWRPSLKFYGKEYARLLSLTAEFLKRADAGRRTTAAFGRRWVRNFFKNLTLIRMAVLFKQAEYPVIITGSGPGLETALPVIEKLKDRCLIAAASSSALALSHMNLSADFVIATDGGSWALRHLYPLYRNDLNTGLLAVNLCAALPSQCTNTPFLIINDGSFWQSIVLNALGLPSVIVTQKGTVSATAVELAMTLTKGNIYLAGIDLCVNDIRTHARPYAFDFILAQNECRFTPVYSQSFTRSSLLKAGGSMDIYASWFKNQLSSWPKRIFSLGGSHEVFETSLPTEKSVLKNSREYFKIVNANEDPALFCKRGAEALLDAFDDSRYCENLRRELAPLLFPGENSVENSELKAAITQIADCYASADTAKDAHE